MSVKEVTTKGPSWVPSVVSDGVSKVLSAGETSARFLLGGRYDKITSYLRGEQGPTLAEGTKSLFQRVELAQPIEKKQPLAPYATATGELPGDLSAVGRIVTFDIMAVDSHPVNPIMGLTTGLNFLWGSLYAQAAYDNMHHAHDIGNYKEENLQKTALAKSVTQLTAGTVFLGIRGLTLASMIDGFAIGTAAPTLAGRVCAYLGHIGSFLFGIYFFLIGLGSGKRLWDLQAFSNKSNKTDTPEKLIEFLNKRIGLDQNDLDASLKKKGISDETLYEEGLNDLTQKFTALFNQLLHNVKGDKIPDHERLYKDLVSPEMRDFSIAHGKELRKALLIAKKEEKMQRLTSAKLVNLIKDASKSDLLGRLQSKNEAVRNAALKELRAIESELQSSMKGNKMVNATVLICAVLGIIATILLLPWIGEFLLVGSVIFLIASLGFLVIDVMGYVNTLESGQQPGKYDKLLHRSLIVSAVIGFIATVGMTLFLGAPLAPILLGLIFTVAVVIVGGIALEKIKEIEAKNMLQPEKPKPAIDWKLIRDQTDALVKKMHEEYEAKIARKAS